MTSQNESLENNHSSARKKLRTLRAFIKRHRNKILLILSIVLIVMAVSLVDILVTKTFKPYFKCAYLIDGTLKTKELPIPISLCDGVGFPPLEITIIPPLPLEDFRIFGAIIEKGWLFSGFVIEEDLFTILPRLDVIDTPLEEVRKFVAWNIILAFAVASLVMAFIASKFKGFINLLRTPAGRKAILSNLNLWLLIFAIFCTLFYYFGVVVPSSGN